MRVVIVGQGYVGLPLAKGAVTAGHEVIGMDLNVERVAKLNNGQSVVDDVSDEEIVEMLANGYRASSTESDYAQAEVIVICVPTPLAQGKQPDLAAVIGAANTIARHVVKDALVILESTTYPGTTRAEIAPIFESAGFRIGTDLYLAFSPERIDPGNQTYGILNTPKVVGADDDASRLRATSFYASFVEHVVPVSGTAEAELTKLLENTYRHINIGLVNELAVVSHEMGINLWEVIDAAATKPFGFQPFYPGPGVGGHCIPIDPNYLNSRVWQVLGRPFRFVELAESINSSMPNYVVSRAQELLNDQAKPLRGSNVLLLGVTYKSGISDTRESPALYVAEILTAKGANVRYFDPLVGSWQIGMGNVIPRVEDPYETSRTSDLTILLQNPVGIDLEKLMSHARCLFDAKGVTPLSVDIERL